MLEKQKYIELLKKSYKKLKSSAYFDRTNPILRDKIVVFERNNSLSDCDDCFETITSKLLDDNDWENYKNILIESIGVIYYPKNIEEEKQEKEDEYYINSVDSEME